MDLANTEGTHKHIRLDGGMSVILILFNQLRYSLHDLVYRVNWLRAKCRKDRWAEELTLVKCEMEWTKLFYTRRVELWSNRATALAVTDPNLHYYARRQAWTWTLLRTQVENAIKASSPGSAQVAK